MNAIRACIVCGCTDDYACVTGDGPCAWLDDRRDLCSACAPAADHVVTMTIDWSKPTGRHHLRSGVHVGRCACGWAHREAKTAPPIVGHTRMDAAIRGHWLAICEAE